jgi:large repetitive protein
VTVTVNPIPASPVVNNTTICSGNSSTLQIINPNTGYTYNWYSSLAGGSLLGTGTSFTTPILTTSTTYYVDAINTTACTSNSRTAVTVTVTPLPAAPSVTDVFVCKNDNAILNINNPQPGATYSWYSVATGGIPIGTGTSYIINNVTSATIIFVESTVAGCSSSTRTSVQVNMTQPLPAPVVTVTTVTQSSISFSWLAIPGATGYEVSTNGGGSFQAPSSGTNGTTHTISGLPMNATINLQVRALGIQVCETSILSLSVSGTTLSTKEIFVPNVFTPNGDGKNDILFVYGNYIASMQFSVFNQWGQVVFYSESIGVGWDGRNSGKMQPIGVYAFTLKVVLNDNTVINKKGSINLVR